MQGTKLERQVVRMNQHQAINQTNGLILEMHYAILVSPCDTKRLELEPREGV